MERIHWGRVADGAPLEVENFGWRCPQHGHRRYPRGNGAWYLRAFHHPTELQVGAERIRTRHETVVLCSPEGALGHAAVGGRGEHSWIRLAGALAGPLVGRSRVPADRAITFAGPERRRHTAGLWREVDAAVRGRVLPASEILEALFRLYLARLAEVARPPAAPRVPPVLLAAKIRIEAGYLRPLGLEALAREAGLSRAHFATRFRRCFGVAPIDYAIRLRIRHAQDLLADPAASVGQIAAACGYGDQFVFSKLFKRHVGVSPSGWRERHLG